MSALESRLVFAAVYPSPQEQYLVELINRARADPAGEASRQLIDLNEGLAPGTISAAPKQPLAVNPLLTDGAPSVLIKETEPSDPSWMFSRVGVPREYATTSRASATASCVWRRTPRPRT